MSRLPYMYTYQALIWEEYSELISRTLECVLICSFRRKSVARKAIVGTLFLSKHGQGMLRQNLTLMV